VFIINLLTYLLTYLLTIVASANIDHIEGLTLSEEGNAQTQQHIA